MSAVDTFLASEAFKPFVAIANDAKDILNAFVEAAGRDATQLDHASTDRALTSVVPRLKKVRLEDAPQLIAAFLEHVGKKELAAEAKKRGEELAREDQKKRVPVKVGEAEPGRNDPCKCGSGKKYKKCCGAGK